MANEVAPLKPRARVAQTTRPAAVAQTSAHRGSNEHDPEKGSSGTGQRQRWCITVDNDVRVIRMTWVGEVGVHVSPPHSACTSRTFCTHVDE